MLPTLLQYFFCFFPSAALILFAAGCMSREALPDPAIVFPRHHLEADSGSWSQYRGNARRTAFAPWARGGEPTILWKVNLGPMIDASPVVASDGTIYVAGPRTTFIPIDQLIAITPDGRVAWRTMLFVANEGRVYQLRSTPAVRKDGSLVVGGHYIEPGRIESGDVRSWNREGRVFLVDTAGNVQARTDASSLFEGGGLTSPAYDGHENAFYWQPYPLAGAGLMRFDNSFTWQGIGGLTVTITGGTGFPAWYNVLCYSLPLLYCWGYAEFDPGPVYPPVGTPPPDDRLTPSPALTQCNDAVAATYETLRTRTMTVHKLWQRNVRALSTPAIGAGGRAYIPTAGSDGGRIEGRDQDGERRFRYDLPSGVLPIGPPALGRGVKDTGDDSVIECRPSDSARDHRIVKALDADNVYVSASDDKLYAIDYKGRLRWAANLVRLTSPPVVLGLGDGQEIILVASKTPAPETGYLWGKRGVDGETLWKIDLDSPVLGSPAVHGDRIYVATRTALYALGYRRAPPDLLK